MEAFEAPGLRAGMGASPPPAAVITGHALAAHQSGYVGGLAHAWGKPDLQSYALSRKWDLEGWMFIAPQSYLDKVAAASGVPYTVSSEYFADDCCSEVAGFFSEGCERANAYFGHWGQPRNVPFWVMRR